MFTGFSSHFFYLIIYLHVILYMAVWSFKRSTKSSYQRDSLKLLKSVYYLKLSDDMFTMTVMLDLLILLNVLQRKQ